LSRLIQSSFANLVLRRAAALTDGMGSMIGNSSGFFLIPNGPISHASFFMMSLFLRLT
jgi:hypothetical protein